MISQTEWWGEQFDRSAGDGIGQRLRIRSVGDNAVTTLTVQQQQALDAYAGLLKTHRELFAGRPRRPIVKDLRKIRAYAAEKGVVLGVLAQTPYLWLLNDLVRPVRATAKPGEEQSKGEPVPEGMSGADSERKRKPRPEPHPYLRIMPSPHLKGIDGVVVLATTAAEDGTERIAVLSIDRHATGSTELELPRGFGSAGATGRDDAKRELGEETGLSGEGIRYLGRTFTDTGLTAGAVSFFHVAVDATQQARPEPEESIKRVVFMTRDQMWARIDRGTLRDAFTLQALALYERALLRDARRRRQGTGRSRR
jgi:ADP-ribose pyrophosphatase